jgi:hypothetical protein
VTRPSQNERILEILRDGRWHTNHEFYSFSVLHSRVSELRSRGHEIEMRRSGGQEATYEYRLVAPLRDPSARPSFPSTCADRPEQLKLDAA